MCVCLVPIYFCLISTHFNLRQGLSLNLELGQQLASPSDLPVASAGGQEQASTILSFLQRFWGSELGPTH